MFRNTYSLKLLYSFFFLLASVASADESKQPLDHSDYDRWNTISLQRISNDGKWIMYVINNGKADGDSTLVIRKNAAPKQYTARFTFDSKFAIYHIAPDPKVVEKLKKDKAQPEAMPSEQMELLELATGDHFTVAREKTETGWLTCWRHLSKRIRSKNKHRMSLNRMKSPPRACADQ